MSGRRRRSAGKAVTTEAVVDRALLHEAMARLRYELTCIPGLRALVDSLSDVALVQRATEAVREIASERLLVQRLARVGLSVTKVHVATAAMARLTSDSWRPIDYSYDALTEAERKLITRDEHALVRDVIVELGLM